jgi:putative ABC transport system permease protein
VLLDGRSTVVTAGAAAALPDVIRVHTNVGTMAAVGPDGLAVSRSTSEERRWPVGTRVGVTFADGATEPLIVRAIYADNAVLGGVVVPGSVWVAHTAQPTERTVFLATASGAPRAAVEEIAARYGGVVQDRSAYAAAATSGLNTLLGIVYVLLALAVLIALLGIANALSLAVHERRREIGLLRAVGQSQRQARSVVRLEALIVSIFGTVVGLALGTFSGWVLFEAVSDRPGFTLPIGRLVVVAVLGGVAGALAARRPAKRAARTPILEAIVAA